MTKLINSNFVLICEICGTDSNDQRLVSCFRQHPFLGFLFSDGNEFTVSDVLEQEQDGVVLQG